MKTRYRVDIFGKLVLQILIKGRYIFDEVDYWRDATVQDLTEKEIQ